VAAQGHSVQTPSSFRNAFGGPSPSSLPSAPKQEAPVEFKAEVPEPCPKAQHSKNDNSGVQSKNQKKKQRRKANKQRNGPNGRTRAANANVAINASVVRTDQENQGQRDAERELQVEAEALEEESKLQKLYVSAVKKIGCRHIRYLGLVLLDHWNGSYYSESVALHELVNQLLVAGLKITLSHNPDIILGVIEADIEAPFHLLSYRVFPGDWDTPFYDQRITSQYMTRVLTKCPRVWWTDGDQMVLCDDGAEQCPRWRNGKRFDIINVPRSFAGNLLPNAPTEERNFLSDDLIRVLIKPHRTFSEMSFGSQVQSVLSSVNRPTWAEWSPGALHDTLLAVNYENYMFFQDRCCYGDRRSKYDDVVVETLTGVRLGGWAVSFGMVKEVGDRYVQPGFERMAEEVQRQWDDFEMPDVFPFNRGDDGGGPEGGSSGEAEGPAPGPQADQQPEREYIREDEPEQDQPEAETPLLEQIQNRVQEVVERIEASEVQWPVFEMPQVPSLNFEQHPIVYVFQGLDQFHKVRKFIKSKRKGIVETLRGWMEGIMEQPLESWTACVDKWSEVRDQLIERLQESEVGKQMVAILSFVQAIKILDLFV